MDTPKLKERTGDSSHTLMCYVQSRMRSRLVCLIVSLPLGVYSICSHIALTNCVKHQDCKSGFGVRHLQAIRLTLSAQRGRLVTNPFCSFCLWEVLLFAKWSNCKSVQCRHHILRLIFFFYFWLPHLASHSALKHHPALSLAQTCQVFVTGKCHLFWEMLLLQTLWRGHYRSTWVCLDAIVKGQNKS